MEPILKKPRTGEGEASASGEYYVPAPVQAIIKNINDATIPERRHSELTQQEMEGLVQRKRAIRQATAAQY